MDETKERWDFLFLVELTFERYEGVTVFLFHFRTNGKKEHSDEKIFCHCHGNFLERTVLKVIWSQLRWKFFLKNYKVHWQQHLRDIIELNILRKWINIHSNYFLVKHHETKIDETA